MSGGVGKDKRETGSLGSRRRGGREGGERRHNQQIRLRLSSKGNFGSFCTMFPSENFRGKLIENIHIF